MSDSAPSGPETAARPDLIPPAIWEFLTREHLAKDEDRAAYGQLVAAVAASEQPANLIEAGYVKVVIDEMWEILRLRRIVPSLYGAQPPQPQYTQPSPELIARIMNPSDAERRECTQEKQELIARIDAARRARLEGRRDSPEALARLSKPPTDIARNAPPAPRTSLRAPSPEDDAALLKAYLQHGPEIERINRLITQAEIRRNTALADLDRLRTVWRLHPAVQHAIVDAEFQEVARHDLTAQGRVQPPKRPGQHRPGQPGRKATGQPKRAQTRARGSG